MWAAPSLNLVTWCIVPGEIFFGLQVGKQRRSAGLRSCLKKYILKKSEYLIMKWPLHIRCDSYYCCACYKDVVYVSTYLKSYSTISLK